MLLAAGAAHVDEIARLQGVLVPGASNPVKWKRTLGGVAANVCRSSARSTARCAVSLLTTVGRDGDGDSIRRALQQLHINTHFLVESDQATGRYTALLDNAGHLVVGLADTAAIETLTEDIILAAVASCTSITRLLLDANLSAACLRGVCNGIARSIPITAMAVSPVKALRLVGIAPSIELLFINRREAAAMTGMTTTAPLADLSMALDHLGFRQHVLTDGAAALLVRDADTRHRVAVPSAQHLHTVNGAGDALAGATLAALDSTVSLLDSVRVHGLPAAQHLLNDVDRAPLLSH